eukprot:542330_1
MSIYKTLFINNNTNPDSPTETETVSLIPLTKLFPFVREITFNNLNITQFTMDAEQYVNVVVECINNLQTATSINLRKIIFQSEDKHRGKINAQLRKLAQKNSKKISQLQWKIEYDFRLHKTHNLIFTKRSYNDGKQMQVKTKFKQQKKYYSKNEEKKINCKQIGNLLFRNELTKNRNELETAMNKLDEYVDEEQLDCKDLCLELMDCLYDSDYAETECLLYDPLRNDLKFSKNKRIKCYDVLLHQYMKLEDFDATQMIQLLLSAMQKYKQINVVKFREEAQAFDLSGKTFKKLTATEFAQIFKKCNRDNNIESILRRIYNEEILNWESAVAAYLQHRNDKITLIESTAYDVKPVSPRPQIQRVQKKIKKDQKKK